MAESLRSLGPGQWGEVLAVTGEGPLKQRLVDMGITPGVRILVRKSAPFGDPIQIALRGYTLSIRGRDAENIQIRREGAR